MKAVDPNDYYRFTLSGRSSFNLTMNGLSADADVQLLNSSGNYILMTQNPQTVPFKISANLLEVYEDLTEPPGSRLGVNRSVGHAVVRLRIENLSQASVDFTIEKIDIRGENGHQSLMSQEVGKINLGGLQILEPGFHLKNRQGFKGSKKVKTVVTYLFNNKTYTTESKAFNVVVNP